MKFFKAIAPDYVHVAYSTDPNVRKTVVKQEHQCEDGHINILYWYDHYDPEPDET